MDPRIENLKSTTFFGRRFTRRQIAEVQQTVAMFPALSRKELGQTICEHLNWRTPTGGNRVKAALKLLEQLEQAGILTLPPKRAENMRPGPRQPPAATRRSDPQPVIEARLRDLEPLRLQVVEQAAETRLWNEFVERHHYLGYRQPLAGLPRCLGRLARGRVQEASRPGGRPAAVWSVHLFVPRWDSVG